MVLTLVRFCYPLIIVLMISQASLDLFLYWVIKSWKYCFSTTLSRCCNLLLYSYDSLHWRQISLSSFYKYNSCMCPFSVYCTVPASDHEIDHRKLVSRSSIHKLYSKLLIYTVSTLLFHSARCLRNKISFRLMHWILHCILCRPRLYRQPLSWCVNRFLPVNPYAHITPSSIFCFY